MWFWVWVDWQGGVVGGLATKMKTILLYNYIQVVI